MQVTAERLVAGGSALAHAPDGRVVFVDGALPGEQVEIELDSAKKDFARGHVVTVAGESPVRRVPPCPHRRAGCGGCDWMHLDDGAQLSAKVGVVTEALTRTGGLSAEDVDRVVRAGATVSPTGYRTTIRVVGDESGRPGYRRQGSREVVAVDSCPVAVDPLSDMLAGLLVEPGVELALRVSLDTGAVTASWDGGRDAVRGLPDGTFTGEHGWLSERVAGRRLRVSSGSFFQSGVDAAQLLVDAVSRAAPELAAAGHCVDLYGGIGLFAATVMKRATHVTVVEAARTACRDAERNVRGRSATVVCAEVARWEPDVDTHGPIEVVVADPARPGLARPGVAAIVASATPVLALVSCDPVSLARDAKLLAASGYTLESLEVLDLFPQTHHVEAVSRFVRT